MKVLRAIMIGFLFVACFSTMALAEMYVSRAEVCTGIENREPVGAADSFTDVDRLYLFSEIKDAGENSQIKHVWYFDNTEVLEVDLTVKGPRWRTWSNKNIYGMKGAWRVDIVDSAGNALRSVPFTVQ